MSDSIVAFLGGLGVGFFVGGVCLVFSIMSGQVRKSLDVEL